MEKARDFLNKHRQLASDRGYYQKDIWILNDMEEYANFTKAKNKESAQIQKCSKCGSIEKYTHIYKPISLEKAQMFIQCDKCTHERLVYTVIHEKSIVDSVFEESNGSTVPRIYEF